MANDISPIASGRFLLRIEPELHDALRAAAAAEELSLNEYCARKLAMPGVLPSGPGPAVVERAAKVAGVGLAGVIAFGSWARGELTADSDIDVLVVVDDDVKLNRALYREWDAEPLRWEGRRVEPHFAHLPEAGTLPSGLWAEVAVEGVVLFDRGLMVSRRLVELRRRILAGEVKRKLSHGQPYWVETA